MNIKSSQSLVSEAMEIVKTISPEEALNLVNENKCNLVDIRDKIDVDKLFQENSFDALIHLAGQVAVTTSIDDPM